MARVLAGVAVCLAVAGCVDSSDPAEGGFYNGIAGLAGGGYGARVAERESGVATSQLRGEEMNAELARLQHEHMAMQDMLFQQRAALRAKGVRMSPDTSARIEAALQAAPSQADPSVRAAALQRAIADARRLSEQLAELAS